MAAIQPTSWLSSSLRSRTDRKGRRAKAAFQSFHQSTPGLPREILGKIPLHTTKPQGNGLGLFIVKAVADNHGAELEAGLSFLGGAELRLVFPAPRRPGSRGPQRT